MLGQEKPQDFELVELLIREAGSNVASTSTQQGSDFESFKARFQSYVDQVPSYLHSVAKQGFFPHFFLGSFSTFIDTEIAAKLDIEKICFCFDGPQTLKVAIIRKGDIKGKKDVIDKIRLFVISEKGAPSATQKFSYGELRDALGRSQPARFQPVFDSKGELRVKSVTIDKGNTNRQGVLVVVEDKKLHEDDASKDKFKEIKKGVWNNPESDIAKLTNSNVGEVEKSSKEILKKVSGIHSEHENSIVYADQAREAAHHGFIAGALVNFRYRYNLRVYLEQFAGRGYADIVLVPRGKDRSLNAVPIIIELKAGTGTGTTPGNALEQAKDYAKGFQPNTMRVLTVSDNVLCVGLNLDSTEKFSMHISPPDDRKPARPTIQKLLEVTSSWSGEESVIADLKKEIKQPLERIYHTFPGTPEKGGNYFSRFMLGQLLLADKFKKVDLKKFIFLYDEYSLASTTRSGKPVTTFALIREGRSKEVFIFHIREGGRGDRSSKKIPIPDNLSEQSKITEVYVSLQEGKKSDFFNIEEVNRYDSLNEYKEGKEFFKGELKDVPYPNGLREAFDEALKSQVTPAVGQSLPVDKYNSLLKKVGEGMFPFRDFINEEVHFQGALHGAFSYYSDLKLGESSRALILTEFQTGRGKRIDMLVHGIKFADQASSAKEYDPVGLELKGPREGKTATALKDEANEQISDEYTKGVTYKTLTDGTEVAFMGVVFDKKAKDASSLILMSKNEFTPVKVVHSSIHMIHPDTVAQPIDKPKEKPLGSVEEVIRGIKYSSIQEEDRRTLESATAEKNYRYWLQQHDIADIARIKYRYGAEGANTIFSIVGSLDHISSQLQQFQNSVRDGEQRPLTLIVNLNNNHWVTLVVSHQDGQYNGYYADSLGNNVPDGIRQVLQQNRIINLHDVSVLQQTDGHNCGLWSLENARDINAVLQEGRSNIPNEIRSRLRVQERDESHFISSRRELSEELRADQQRIDNLQNILAETQQSRREFDPNSCMGQSSRSKRSVNSCLFSKDDVEKFSKGKVDENNVDKVIVEIDSEKFLTYVKSSKDEGKNAQLIEFIGNKNIEGDYKYLVDKVIGDQGYERYVQNERIKDLHGDIVHQESSLTKNPKLKSRLMNAAGGIQLIRGIHGAIVSCKDGTATDCGLNLGGIGWSFASQPIENVMVKITPRVVTSAEKVVGKVIPGALGKQTKFAIRVAGVKFGSTIAKGTAGALTGVFDIVDIGMSASNLVDCKKRENSDNPCGEKEIRDNIASISFSGVSFVSGVALTAASMPVVGIAVGFGLMVGYGIYSGVSNIVEYKKKYDTTHGENWSIFWRTLLFQPMAADVQHLAARKDTVNSLAKQVWKALNNGPNSTVAYGIGLGKVSGNTLRPDYAKIIMDKEHADTRSISRVIPDLIKNAKMICLPRITNADYEKGLKKSVSTAVHYCDNAMVIADGRKSMQNGKTIVYDLRNVNSGNIIGSNVLDNSFLIFEGSEKIIGGDNTVNRFVLTNSRFAGRIIVGTNSTNVFDLSQIADSIVKVNIGHSIGSTTSKTLHSGVLEIKMNDRSLINECVTNDVNILGYHYIGRQNKTDEVSCTSSTGDFIDYDTIIDSKGGYNNDKRDIIENCDRAIILPYTDVRGTEGNYVFYIKAAGYKGKDLHSEINVKGTGTVIFPETDLLNDCDEITYSSNNNTLSLKIGLGQNNRYTLDIKNYIKQSTSKPNFILIDKNGSNIVPKIKELGAIKINSFELHSEYALDNFDDVENHYKKILNNNKDYKVFSVIRGKTQNQDNNAVPHMVFGSLGDDIVNFDQGTTFARGGEGNDVYLISGDINSREVKIDNNSNDKKLDILFMPMVEKDFSVQQCDLHLNYNNTSIQVKNYLQDRNCRHLIIMNKKGETFIPNIQSISCSPSSSRNGKLVPFFHATQAQNMFVLPKDFQDDHVVIDSRLEDIERYRNKDHLLLIRNNEVPFIIKVENFYDNQSKWRNVNFFLWNDGNFSSYLGLQQEVNGIMDYQDKLKSDYEKTVKEYTIDFNESVDITHNQNGTLNSVEEDEKHIGVMILKDITPDRIKVSSINTDLVFSDEVSNHVINVKNWNNSESYRISTLEFDLGLEPIIIRRLDRFSLSDIAEIQGLINKASEICQKKAGCEANIEAKNNDGQTLFHVAAQEGKLRSIRFLIGKIESMNFEDNLYSEPDELVKAVRQRERLKSLINEKDKFGYTPLQYAAKNGKWDIVNLFLDKTAERNQDDVADKDKFSTSWTTVHYAVYNGNMSLFNDIFQFLSDKETMINTKDSSDWTPLHYAVYYNALDVVKFLVNKGADISVKDKDSKTPLDLAAQENDTNVAEFLKQTELDKKLLAAVQDAGLNEVKDLINQKANINAKYMYGWTPLHFAASRDKLSVVEFLFNNNANINAKDVYGNTPLHVAAQYSSSLEIVKFLLDKDISGINNITNNGWTPLHVAIQGNKLNTVELLLGRGADIEVRDIYNQTSLDLATRKGYLDIAGILKQVQLDRKLLTIVESGGFNEAKGLIAQGANIDTNDKNGNTLLYSAAEIGDLNLVKLLLDNGANIEAKNGEYQATPLHGAVENYRIDVVKLLLNRGANVNAEDKDNWTPLHYGADTNSLDIVKVLVDAHANLGAKGNYGKTPLDIAKDKGHNNIVEYLEKKLREERGERKRRHHHGDHNSHNLSRKPLAIDQPQIATSSGAKPSSWINDLFSRVKSSVGRLLSSKSEGTASSLSQVDGQFAKALISNSSFTGTTLPSDGTDKRQENGGFFRDNVDYVNANLKRMCERQAPVKFKPKDRNTILEMGDHYLSQVDFNGTITLFDLLIRRVTGQKYISTIDQSISPLEAQEYTLNITKGFEKVVEQAGLKSGVSMHRLNIDYMGMQKEITRKVMSGKFNEISGVLSSYIEKACPSREAGKLSPKKFDKFMIEFNKGLDITLNQSIQQILNNRNSTLEVNDVKEQQISLEPQSYLSNASVQGHLTRNKVKLIS